MQRTSLKGSLSVARRYGRGRKPYSRPRETGTSRGHGQLQLQRSACATIFSNTLTSATRTDRRGRCLPILSIWTAPRSRFQAGLSMTTGASGDSGDRPARLNSTPNVTGRAFVPRLSSRRRRRRLGARVVGAVDQDGWLAARSVRIWQPCDRGNNPRRVAPCAVTSKGPHQASILRPLDAREGEQILSVERARVQPANNFLAIHRASRARCGPSTSDPATAPSNSTTRARAVASASFTPAAVVHSRKRSVNHAR
jgi:hypothetical protein